MFISRVEYTVLLCNVTTSITCKQQFEIDHEGLHCGSFLIYDLCVDLLLKFSFVHSSVLAFYLSVTLRLQTSSFNLPNCLSLFLDFPLVFSLLCQFLFPQFNTPHLVFSPFHFPACTLWRIINILLSRLLI